MIADSRISGRWQAHDDVRSVDCMGSSRRRQGGRRLCIVTVTTNQTCSAGPLVLTERVLRSSHKSSTMAKLPSCKCGRPGLLLAFDTSKSPTSARSESQLSYACPGGRSPSLRVSDHCVRLSLALKAFGHALHTGSAISPGTLHEAFDLQDVATRLPAPQLPAPPNYVACVPLFHLRPAV